MSERSSYKTHEYRLVYSLDEFGGCVDWLYIYGVYCFAHRLLYGCSKVRLYRHRKLVARSATYEGV